MAIPLGKISSRGEGSTIAVHRLPSPVPSDEGDVQNPRDLEQPVASPMSPDPYNLKSSMMSEEQLSELRKRSGKKKNEIVAFHRRQNELIHNVLKPMEEHTEDARAAEEQTRIPVKIAIWASLIANFCLCVLQLYATASSGSLSILATGIDSAFDVGSNILLFYIHRKAENLDHNKWPVGGSRLETIGDIVYGSLMGAVNLVVIVESVRVLVSHTGGGTNEFHLASILAVAAALGVKLGLFLYCFSIRDSSGQVRVLWEDHRNDLFINSFGILMSSGGAKLTWWLDPMGGMILAIGVILSWSRTVYKLFELLAGKSAPHDFIQLITYKAATFSDEIEKVDTVRAYHSGPDYFVEVDIVMSSTTPLWKAHDIAQILQDKIEVLPGVDRAFVHVDHETTHAPEHRKHM
ncbi:hypothetical protein DL93DRAFT_2088238 [Clavulina sp. PMI_390]|nr:hypothetical protein DL93DRAFT_2088238 [Clavulina sp. PMI_390]